MKTKSDPNRPALTNEGGVGAFTLIELLVVIAIIAIIAAMLLPVLSRAKETSRKIACTNNLKQLLLGCHLYTSDNKDFWPFANWESGVSGTPGWLTVAPYRPNDMQTGIQKSVLWPYEPDFALWRCPSVKTNTPTFILRDNKLSDYIMNGAACDYMDPPNNKYYKIGQFRQDALLLWMGPDSVNYNDGSNSPDEPISRLHSDGSTFGVVDGHVEFMKFRIYRAMEIGERVRMSGRFYCTPN
ncbi:MAG TPA: DUF1559 domain-containing protein [Verrucomicrobiae bacterium]|jgi:prepilin-type N-terminal cleavage/methylation domain-containing protein|nr:DUF1559 domain-containing protein [Verrucomicrobiae bacterium]